MAEDAATRRRRRQRRHRRRSALGVAVVLIAVGGAGTAYAMRGSDTPTYRLATVKLGDVSQTVSANGSLSARHTAALSFAVAGTVTGVAVAVGDKVTAGQTLATMDPTSLAAAVTSAQSALAQAQQTMADDQTAQANGVTVTRATSGSSTGGGSSNGTTTSNTTTSNTTTSNTTTSNTTGGVATNSVSTHLISAVTPVTGVQATGSSTGSGSTGGGSTGSNSTGSGSTGGRSTQSITQAQTAVVTAQQTLDRTITAQDAAVKTLVAACAATEDTAPAASTTIAGTDGTVAGSVGSSPSVVTLRTSGGDVAQATSTNPQRVAANGTFSFAGLTAGTSYRLEITRTGVVNTTDCQSAVSSVVAAQQDVDHASNALNASLTALTAVIARSTGSSSPGSGSGSGTSGSGTSGSRTSGSRTSGSGASGSGSTGSGSKTATSSGARTGSSTSSNSAGSASGGVTVTAEMIAADAKTIDAKSAALAVAKQALTYATLTSSTAGIVAAVNMVKGNSVSASSSTSTITVVGTGTLSVVVDIPLTTIDLIKVGEQVAVSVDGRTTPVPAHVAYVGTTNASSSTTASYPVTVSLDSVNPSLYDGMGANLAISVGSATRTLTVPISAVHTTGRRSTVQVYSAGAVQPTLVTLGVVGADTVQVKTGLIAGQQVVLADVSAAVPTSSTNTTRRNRTGLTGGLGGAGGGFGGGTRGVRPGG